MASTMMSSAKARPENAELERRVKSRLQRLQRKRCPPSCVVPSFVTPSELHRGHNVLLHPAYPAPLSGKRTIVSGPSLHLPLTYARTRSPRVRHVRHTCRSTQHLATTGSLLRRISAAGR